MLSELRVENLLLIEAATLRLGPGLNVLTGETGAGKTVLAHALDLLLGGKARPSIVRPGSAEAYVEGVFDLDDTLRTALGDRVAPDAEELVLARRVSAEGRSRAYLNGRSVNVTDLRDVAESLIAFYGQHEHRRLMLASAQRDVLAGACGPDQSVPLHHPRIALRPNAIVARNRAVALAERDGPEAGLAALTALDAAKLDDYQPFHAARADLLARAGHTEAAAGAYDRALALTTNPAERAFLVARLAGLGPPTG